MRLEKLKKTDICFVLRERILCRVGPEVGQLVVLDTLRPKVLYLDHNVPWSGHLGREQTGQAFIKIL